MIKVCWSGWSPRHAPAQYPADILRQIEPRLEAVEHLLKAPSPWADDPESRVRILTGRIAKARHALIGVISYLLLMQGPSNRGDGR